MPSPARERQFSALFALLTKDIHDFQGTKYKGLRIVKRIEKLRMDTIPQT